MEKKAHVTSSIVAASCITALTLSVFLVSRNSGPISAVTRFHQSVSARDAKLLVSVSVQPIDDPNLAVLVNQVEPFLKGGRNIQYTLVSKSAGIANVSVTYQFPRGYWSKLYVLRHGKRQWYIDAKDTLTQANRAVRS